MPKRDNYIPMGQFDRAVSQMDPRLLSIASEKVIKALHRACQLVAEGRIDVAPAIAGEIAQQVRRGSSFYSYVPGGNTNVVTRSEATIIKDFLAPLEYREAWIGLINVDERIVPKELILFVDNLKYHKLFSSIEEVFLLKDVNSAVFSAHTAAFKAHQISYQLSSRLNTKGERP